MSDLFQFLHQENIQPELLDAVREYRAMHAVQEALLPRIPVPRFPYYGKSIWDQAIAAVLCGENLSLAGGKATGKNVLAENLAALFGRPEWDISFHVNMDAASLIGTDTFVNGAVQFRPGPVYSCAQHGGFGILDEINMAKNEALAVLHAILDFRRAIDVPGYDRIPLAEAIRQRSSILSPDQEHFLNHTIQYRDNRTSPFGRLKNFLFRLKHYHAIYTTNRKIFIEW